MVLIYDDEAPSLNGVSIYDMPDEELEQFRDCLAIGTRTAVWENEGFRMIEHWSRHWAAAETECQRRGMIGEPLFEMVN